MPALHVPKVIQEFRGPYQFLSNFWKVQIKYGELVYPTVEHAYQAAKTVNLAERKAIWYCTTPDQAKALGKTLTLIPEWETRRLEVMKVLTFRKYQGYHLRTLLYETFPAELEEGNYWHDVFWGISPAGSGNGMNHLGKIIMAVREEYMRWDGLIL